MPVLAVVCYNRDRTSYPAGSLRSTLRSPPNGRQSIAESQSLCTWQLCDPVEKGGMMQPPQTHRERVLTSAQPPRTGPRAAGGLQHDRRLLHAPPRAPGPAARAELQYQGDVSDVVQPHEDLLQRLDLDTRDVAFTTTTPRASTWESDETYENELGVGFRKHGVFYYYAVEHPLAGERTVADVENYPWPEPDPSPRTALGDKVRAMREETGLRPGDGRGRDHVCQRLVPVRRRLVHRPGHQRALLRRPDGKAAGTRAGARGGHLEGGRPGRDRRRHLHRRRLWHADGPADLAGTVPAFHQAAPAHLFRVRQAAQQRQGLYALRRGHLSPDPRFHRDRRRHPQSRAGRVPRAWATPAA